MSAVLDKGLPRLAGLTTTNDDTSLLRDLRRSFLEPSRHFRLCTVTATQENSRPENTSAFI